MANLGPLSRQTICSAMLLPDSAFSDDELRWQGLPPATTTEVILQTQFKYLEPWSVQKLSALLGNRAELNFADQCANRDA